MDQYYHIRKSKGRYREYRDHNKSYKLYASESNSKMYKSHASRARRRMYRSSVKDRSYTSRRLDVPNVYKGSSPIYTRIAFRSYDESLGDKCPDCGKWYCPHIRYAVTLVFLMANRHGVLPYPVVQIIAKMIYDDVTHWESEIYRPRYYTYHSMYVKNVRKDRLKRWWE